MRVGLNFSGKEKSTSPQVALVTWSFLSSSAASLSASIFDFTRAPPWLGLMMHHKEPRYWTQVFRLGSKHPLRYFTSFIFMLFWVDFDTGPLVSWAGPKFHVTSHSSQVSSFKVIKTSSGRTTLLGSTSYPTKIQPKYAWILKYYMPHSGIFYLSVSLSSMPPLSIFFTVPLFLHSRINGWAQADWRL